MINRTLHNLKNSHGKDLVNVFGEEFNSSPKILKKGEEKMSSISIQGRYYRQYPPEKFLGHTNKNLLLDLKEIALLVVDVYGLGFDQDGRQSTWSGMCSDQSIAREGEVIVNHIVPAINACRNVNIPIVYISNSAPRINLANSMYEEVKKNTLNFVTETTYSEPNVDPLEYSRGESNTLAYSNIIAPKPNDYFIRKHVHSGFFDTRLDTLLRNLGVKTLIFVGFALDVCLGSTMMDALWRNYRNILLRDCTYAIEIPGIDAPGAWTERWITYVESNIGYTATSQELIEAIILSK